jgi:hypothetical protein
VAAQTVPSTRELDVAGEAPQVCAVGQPTLAQGRSVNFRSLTGGTLTIDRLTDATTLSTAAASVELGFEAVCNYPHRIVLESENNGLWRSGAGGAPAPEGFADAVPYTATLRWGALNERMPVDGTSRRMQDGTYLVNQATAGRLALRVDIAPGASNGRANAPMVAGVYQDVLRLTVGPQ